MTYAAGQTILRDEYNIFATGAADGTATNSGNINNIWGAGNGNSGYGQSTTLTAVSTGNTITATQWANMVARLDSISKHQTGSGYTPATGPNPITAGSTITAVSDLATTLATLYTNRLVYTAQGTNATSTTTPATWNSATPTTFTIVRTFTFADENSARYFFNSGGQIGITFATASAADTDKEIKMAELIASVGTHYLRANSCTRSGTGNTQTTFNSATGYYDLTLTATTALKLTEDTAPYTTNTIDIKWSTNALNASGLGGKGNIITCTIVLTENATDDFNDAFNFTITTTSNITPPETTYLTSTWGTPTAAATTN
jgi:hypothetical protein